MSGDEKKGEERGTQGGLSGDVPRVFRGSAKVGYQPCILDIFAKSDFARPPNFFKSATISTACSWPPSLPLPLPVTVPRSPRKTRLTVPRSPRKTSLPHPPGPLQRAHLRGHRPHMRQVLGRTNGCTMRSRESLKLRLTPCKASWYDGHVAFHVTFINCT